LGEVLGNGPLDWGKPRRRQALGAGKVLAAVVQKGRLFERAHPDVTVLRRRGCHPIFAAGL
jgi:hypothetical protein